jgi:hypothetical protein
MDSVILPGRRNKVKVREEKNRRLPVAFSGNACFGVKNAKSTSKDVSP